MNHRITALTQQKRNRQRVNIFLDGEYSFSLTRIVAAWLGVGMELSDEKIAQLQSEDERETAYQRVLNYIAYQPRTAQTVRQYLQRRKIHPDTIGWIMERLERSGLINDADYAQRFVGNRVETHPRGRRALFYELKRRGVPEDLIEESTKDINEEKLAYQAALHQARKYIHLEWKVYRQKMLRYLAQRGFDYETSSEAARRVWEEQRVTEPYQDEEAEP